jgi:adenylate cyclase
MPTAMGYVTAEQEWHDLLMGTHAHLSEKSPLRFIPSNPRCKLCKAPFGSPGRIFLARAGYVPWDKNPNICGRCFKGIATLARQCPGPTEDPGIAGAEVEISMLFADVRGSSKIARTMPVFEFTRLMQRFYEVSKHVLIDADAIIEKFVGDEVVGLFVPFLAGQQHAARAIETAMALLAATGHGSSEGPWCPLGASVHTGTVFVGIVGSGDGTSDFTALGDAMNVAAHLASQAPIGEVLVTVEAAEAAALATEGRERRSLSLKGHPVEAFALPAEPLAEPAADASAS